MAEGTQDLRAVGACWAEAAAADLTGLFGSEVRLSEPDLDGGERDGLLPRSGEVVCSHCPAQDGSSGDLWFVLSMQAAHLLAAPAAGTDPGDFEAFAAQPFEGDVETSYQQAMELCAGILGRVFDEEAGLPAVQLQDSVVVEMSSVGNAPPPGQYRRARFQLEIEGFPKDVLDVFIREEQAKAWFGASAEASGGGGGASCSLDLPVALIDPSAESRDQFGQIVQDLGGKAILIDPEELHGDAFDDLLETSWVVGTWDMGGRPGLDLLERLQSNDETRSIPFALASATPTRMMVDAALRWGVRTMLFQPWDADEIRERLFES